MPHLTNSFCLFYIMHLHRINLRKLRQYLWAQLCGKNEFKFNAWLFLANISGKKIKPSSVALT